MKKVQYTLSPMLPVFVLVAAVFSAQLMHAQSAQAPSPRTQTAQDQQKMQPEDQTSAQKIFTGTIVKSGSKLVLTDSVTKTSYQLDDQEKAQSFLNKNVKVTGVLDASTGTIRVTTIDPV
jgi:uncharacterized protein DUF5818